MKRVCAFLTGLFLTGSLFAFAACSYGGSYSSGKRPAYPSFSVPTERVDPLAALDGINIKQAFGDTTAEDWSFTLGALTDMGINMFVSSEDSLGTPMKNYAFGVDAELELLLGLRKDKTATGGVGMFGSGAVGLAVAGDINGETFENDFRATVSTDEGIFFAESEGGKLEYDLPYLASKLENSIVTGWLYEVVETLPESVKNGFGLRFGVEKLVEFGFVAEVDTTAGTKITVRATKAFFTGLINDLLETVAPFETFLPRIDFEYRSTVFELKLDFDEEDRFERFALYSDVNISASMNVPLVATYRGGIGVSGGFEISAVRSTAE